MKGEQNSTRQNIYEFLQYDKKKKEGGKTLTEFPNTIELGKLRPGQDPNNKETPLLV